MIESTYINNLENAFIPAKIKLLGMSIWATPFSFFSSLCLFNLVPTVIYLDMPSKQKNKTIPLFCWTFSSTFFSFSSGFFFKIPGFILSVEFDIGSSTDVLLSLLKTKERK